ncbi:MAG: hypothetical protein HQK84_05825 [Nitrospinae bacterium]|nr:hypothetical protein [Nitrospinota bacterium]
MKFWEFRDAWPNDPFQMYVDKIFKDPVAWQREIRKDRPLPGRESE